MLEVYRLSIRQLTGPVRLGLIILLSALAWPCLSDGPRARTG